MNSFLSPFDKLALIFIKLNELINKVKNIVTVGDAVDGLWIHINRTQEFINNLTSTVPPLTVSNDTNLHNSTYSNINLNDTKVELSEGVSLEYEYESFVREVETILKHHESKRRY